MEKLKVLVVDDSAVYRKIIASAVEATGVAQAEHLASNGIIALERMQNTHYDVVLLDVNMPDMDGIEVLKQINKRWTDMPVIMISSTGGRNATITIKALELGAMDFILKPLEQDYEKNMVILKNHLKALFALIQIKLLRPTGKKSDAVKTQPEHGKTSILGADIVLIAASTGGPSALNTLFECFKSEFNKPVLVVQHMPPNFTHIMAETLDKKSAMNIIEGDDGDIIKAGQAIIAPGGMHMQVQRINNSTKAIKLASTEYVNGVRPSADVLFKSVAEEYSGARVLVVILTGMGNDGMEGVMELKKKCSCYCITQDEKSCVVYGMPRSVVEAGLSDEAVDITQISRRIRTISEHGS